jgi:hypothetical protein
MTARTYKWKLKFVMECTPMVMDGVIESLVDFGE